MLQLYLTIFMAMEIGFVKGEWIVSKSLPSGAIAGGVDTDGLTLYVCRAFEAGRIQCGKARYHSGRSTCYVPQNWREHQHPNFDILIKPERSHDRYDWVYSYGRGRVPPNTVQCSPGIYVGRYQVKDKKHGLQVGKTDGTSFWYGYGGREHRQMEGYQVLVKTTRKLVSYKMTNVRYDLNRASEEINPKPITVGYAEVQNNSPRETNSRYRLSFQTSTSFTWSHTLSVSLEVGVSMTVSASVPGILEMSKALHWSITASYTYSNEKSVSETVSHTIEQMVSLPPRSKAIIRVSANKEQVGIPYTANLVSKYDNGDEDSKPISGTFQGVTMTKFVTETSKK